MCQEIITKHMNGHIDITNTQFKYNQKTEKGTLAVIVFDVVK